MDVDIHKLYQLLFLVTNKFLAMANKFSIQELQQEHDPDVDSIASDATDLSKIMNQIADEKWEDERLAMNAAQAALHMRMVAIAVRKGNQELFDKALADLEAQQSTI